MMDPRTAKRNKSIWKTLNEDTFRKQLIVLSKSCGQVPSDSVLQQAHLKNLQDNLLKLEVIIARSFAFIAAAQEGVDTVSAAYVEGIKKGHDVIVHLASNVGVSPAVRQDMDLIIRSLNEGAKREIPFQEARSKVFSQIIGLNKARIHARLRSRMWQPAPYLRFQAASEVPLWQSLKDLHNDMSVRPQQAPTTAVFKDSFNGLIKTIMEKDQSLNIENEVASLALITEQCHALCSSGGQRSFADTLSAAGLRHLLHNKHVRQLEKIADYLDIAILLTSAWRKYRSVLGSAKMLYVTPYAPIHSNISLKGTRVSCHVHAEVQLIVHHDLHSSIGDGLLVIGTSKAACFLCAQFIHFHNSFEYEKAHLRIFDQWTIPDLAQFSTEQVTRYRMIIAQMYQVMKRLVQKQSPGRPFPLTSWLDLQGKAPFSGPSSKKTTPLLSEFNVTVASLSKDSNIPERAVSHHSTPIPESIQYKDLEPLTDDSLPDRHNTSIKAKSCADTQISKSSSLSARNLSIVHQENEASHGPEIRQEIFGKNVLNHDSQPNDMPAQYDEANSCTEKYSIQVFSTNRVFDLHKCELFFEFENSNTTQVRVQSCNQSSDPSQIVDVDNLMPKEELVVEFQPMSTEESSLVLKTKKGTQGEQYIKLIWQSMASG